MSGRQKNKVKTKKRENPKILSRKKREKNGGTPIVQLRTLETHPLLVLDQHIDQAILVLNQHINPIS